MQAGSGRGVPSTATMQTRQAPNGAWRSSKQTVGTQRPAAWAASRIVVPGATSSAVPSIVTRSASGAASTVTSFIVAPSRPGVA